MSSRNKAHLEGATCGGFCIYSANAMRVLALDGQACKRCLASLAKRDRAFQLKARQGLAYIWHDSRLTARHCGENRTSYAMFHGRRQPGDAARAIAREEVRAL